MMNDLLTFTAVLLGYSAAIVISVAPIMLLLLLAYCVMWYCGRRLFPIDSI